MNSQPPLFPISDISAPIWPRRASKACASCRRDKIRCDGSRPCSGCTKKGYTADQCIDGCEQCRRARVRCEDGKPCQRCREMHLECLEEPTTPLSRHDPSNSPIRGARPNGSDRAKLACQNCRRDNKKCDDQRPCSRCVARSEQCIHVGRGPKLVKLRCEGCRQDNKRCEDVRPCKHCLDQGRQCVNLPRKGRGHGTRVKAACTNCRRDKIRCDGIRPCASCVRKGHDCLDRACKTCARNGKDVECTHRRGQDAGGSDHDEPVDNMHVNAHASSSNHGHTQPQPHLQSQLVLHSQPHLPLQHPAMYGPMGPVQHFYYPTPQPVVGPGHPPNMMQNSMYAPDHRSGYFPIIDPSIDDHTGPLMSSERVSNSESHTTNS